MCVRCYNSQARKIRREAEKRMPALSLEKLHAKIETVVIKIALQ
jgi:hypothetical protein